MQSEPTRVEIATTVGERPGTACVRDLSSVVTIRMYAGVSSQLQLLDNKLSRRLGTPPTPSALHVQTQSQADGDHTLW
jgi:hypothetical protein